MGGVLCCVWWVSGPIRQLCYLNHRHNSKHCYHGQSESEPHSFISINQISISLTISISKGNIKKRLQQTILSCQVSQLCINFVSLVSLQQIKRYIYEQAKNCQTFQTKFYSIRKGNQDYLGCSESLVFLMARILVTSLHTPW